MKGMEIKINLTKERVTKGAVIYIASTDEDKEKIQNLYIRKSAFNGEDYPETATLTFEG